MTVVGLGEATDASISSPTGLRRGLGIIIIIIIISSSGGQGLNLAGNEGQTGH